MGIPILWQHDFKKIIGKFETCESENCGIVTFYKGFELTYEQFFNIFNCSAIIMEDEWPSNVEFSDNWQKYRIIRKAKILNFTIDPIKTYQRFVPFSLQVDEK